MENSDFIFEAQNRLFEDIKKNLPEQYALVDMIADVLDIGMDSAYRRINCKKLLSIKETATLCRHFKISFDSLIGNDKNQQLNYIYRPVNLSKPDAYLNYILALANIFGKLRASADSSIILSAIDIPVFHLLSQKELIFFKLYAWSHSVYDYTGSLEDFIKETETPKINSLHQQICNDYEYIASAEIFTTSSLENTLRLINYYVEIGKFTSRDFPLLLCEQILNILDRKRIWAENSYKNDYTIPYKLFLSEIDFECSYILLNNSGEKNCFVKLFTVNNIKVMDKDFCIEAENYLTKLSQRSVLLCGSSEKERIKFFNSQQQKIRYLMEKIRQSF